MDVQFETQDHSTITLDSMINEHEQKTMVVFVRHLGWPVCREYLTQLRERIEEFKNEEVSVWVVAPSNAQFIGQFLDAFGPFPFPIIGDPERAAYREMGHKSMAKWKLYWLSAVGFFTSKMNNFIPKDAQQKRVVMKSIQTQDIFIQGGTYLYSKDGRLIWKHVDVSPEDHAKLDTVLKESKKSWECLNGYGNKVSDINY